MADSTPQTKGDRQLGMVVGTAVVAGTLALIALVTSSGALIESAPGWWLVVAAGYFVTDSVILHLEGKREAHSVSLVELPLTVGLLYLGSPELLAARIIGSGLSLLLVRRSRGAKLAFNLALFTAETALAASLVHALLNGAPSATADWVLVVGVVAATNLLSGLLTGVTIARADLSELDGLPTILAFQLAFALSSASLGVAVVRLSLESVTLAVFPLIAVTGLYLTLRASVKATQRLNDLEHLYGFTSAVDDSVLVDGFIGSLLSRTRELMRANQAILVLLDEDGEYTEYTVGDDGRVSKRPAQQVDQLEPLAKLGGPSLLDGTSPILISRDIGEAIVTPVRVDGTAEGLLIIADRQGAANSFDGLAMRMAASLVNHLSINLQNVLLLQRMADQQLTDTMTHLPTRAVLEQHVAATLARPDSTAAVVVIDLTRFRDFNDAFGHTRGDELIVEVARRLRSAVGEHDIVARLGGDEFGLLLPGTTAADAPAAIRRIIETLERPVLVEGTPVVMSCTMGLAVGPHDGVESEILLARADSALHAARSASVDWQRYDPANDPSSPDRLRLAHDLRTAILGGHIEVWFQPILTAVRYEMVQVEALLRWTHPRLGPQAPEHVVDLARQWGLGRQLTSLVLERAVEQAAQWHRNDLCVGVSVNLTAQDIADSEIVEVVAECLESHDLDPTHLHIELTETSLLSDPERSSGILQRLSSLGIRTSVDDFGTGYSSLAYLRQLPIDALKIDRSFVLDLRDGEREEVIVRSIIELGHALGLQIVAEGVEDIETAERLARMGCDLLQGYAFGRPSPASVVEESLRVRSP